MMRCNESGLDMKNDEALLLFIGKEAFCVWDAIETCFE